MMLADEHELWLQSYDVRYLKKWKDLFRAVIEPAMGEAEIRRRLQNLGSTVEPNEDLNTGKAAPDFRCSCSGYEFFVEVACITIAAAEDKTGISHVTPHQGAVRMLNQAIFQKCVKKARQAGFVNAPVLVAVGTWHAQAAMEFSDMAMLNTLLTGDQLHSWGFNAQTGEKISPHQSTNLYPAIFLKHDEEFHAMPARESISGLLLCAFGMPGIAPVIVLNPNAYHRGFDGRVAQIEGLEGLFINSTVAELRKTVNTGQIPLTSGSPTICNALNYMCNLYKVDFRGDEIASDGQ